MQGISECMEAIRIAADMGTRRSEQRAEPLRATASINEPIRMLDEPTGKALLAQHGLTIPQSRVVALNGVTDAANMIGYPVVVKAVSDQLAHKTEAGAVKLNLITPDAALEAATSMAHLSNRFLVEAMQTNIVAEMIVGITRDPLFGPTLTFGSGGILVELLKDTASLLLPVSRAEVEHAFNALKLSHLVDGFRGKPKGDRKAAIDAIMAVAGFAEAHRDTVVELDANPVLILEHGAVAVDAMIRIADGKTP
jgi:acetate---CoA ligase (ADP-forming)